MKMNKINSKDVSVVIQGKNITDHTIKCLNSIRKNFPDAEIIFSTYENEDVSGLDFDILITSVDPKATLLCPNMYNNMNRILTTTRAGLNKVSRKYCLKIRSDLFFDNDKILSDFSSLFPIREEYYKIFKQRVVFYSLWTRKFEYIANKYRILTPFYLSDWLCFGLTEDIKLYFNAIEFTNEPYFSKFFKNTKNNIHNCEGMMPWQFPPEQYFATSFFKKYFEEADMKSLQDFSLAKMELSRRIFASNVVICGYKECGAYNQKSNYKFVSKNINWLKGIWLSGVYRYADFLLDYQKYCDKKFKTQFCYKWMTNEEIDKFIIKINKHFKIFIAPFKCIIKWLEQIVSLAYYTTMLAIKTFAILFHISK